jgi:type I restriction enzyme S subunit
MTDVLEPIASAETADTPLSRFRPYPEYKDSGVAWLGEVPSGWEITRLGRHCDLLTGFPFKSESYSYQEGIRLVRGDNITEGELRWGDKARFWNEGGLYLQPYFLEPNDVVVGMDGSKVGKNYAFIHQEDPPLLLVQRVARLRSRPTLDPRFLFGLVGSELFRTWVDLVKTDPAIPHVSPSDIRRFPIAVPPRTEQHEITSFLDRETTKIDALIAKKERFIELLEEQRSAVISHAVTKGLDPNVPMKDSGVEWIGEVPAHWAVSSLSHAYSVQLGKMLDSKNIQGTSLNPYLRNSDVQWDYINVQNLPVMDFSAEDRKRFALAHGDLMVCEGGDVGRAAIWKGELEECYYQKALHRLRPISSHQSPRFFYYVLFAAHQAGIFKANGNPNTIDHLPAEAFRKFRFTFPPLKEQVGIADLLDLRIGTIDEFSGRARRTISLLREYRTALISAAVTGKIDVRGEVAA